MWVIAGFMLLAGAGWAEYTNATMHHAFDSMEDADENGVPDSLDAYLSETTLPDPYDPRASDLDGDGSDDFGEWILGTDPLTVEQQQMHANMQSTTNGMMFAIELPAWFGRYAEVFARPSLCAGCWEAVDSWIPTYGEPQLIWEDVLHPRYNSFFYRIFDGTFDLDGDGFSDHREYFITHTDPTVFDEVNTDGDWMHDWYEIRHFGDLSQTGSGDFDGDSLLNNEELVWLSDTTVCMYSDPSLYDSDADTLNDAEEGADGTNPMEADTDADGFDDADELDDRTDPNNPDSVSPIVTLSL